MLQYLVFFGAAVSLYGIFFYLRDTLRGKTKPNKVTWLMWSVAPLIATVATLSKGAGWIALPVFMSGFTPLLVFIASFINPKAYWELKTFDYLCGFFSILALVLWLITKEPNIAIVFAIISDGFAAIPTLAKCWKSPETESSIAYSTGLICSLTGFFAVSAWKFSEVAFPIYLVSVSSLLLFSIYHRTFLKLVYNKRV